MVVSSSGGSVLTGSIAGPAAGGESAGWLGPGPSPWRQWAGGVAMEGGWRSSGALAGVRVVTARAWNVAVGVVSGARLG